LLHKFWTSPFNASLSFFALALVIGPIGTSNGSWHDYAWWWVDPHHYVRKRLKCEIHGDKINAHLTSLFNMASSWPFDVSGLDVIGSINLKASNEHKFILVAIDYFTKWVEASSYNA
jgi:hypothetical protein